MKPDTLDISLDRGLTLGGYVPSGRYSERTAKLYASCWSDFHTWCSDNGLTAMPSTSETLARYASHLLTAGYTRGTAQYRVAAIKSRHRTEGHQVPDGVPTWAVLHSADDSRVRPPVNGITREHIRAAAKTCQRTTIGTRNRTILLLGWDALLAPTAIVGLDVEDVDDDDGTVTIVAGGDIVLDHDHTTSLEVECPQCQARPGDTCLWSTGERAPWRLHHGRERAAGHQYACPACAVSEWVMELSANGVHTGALMRPVDREGTIAQPGVDYIGCHSPDFRLSTRSVHRVWERLVSSAGLPRYTPRSARLGGARTRVDDGQPLSEVIHRAGWSPTAPSVVRRLME